MTTQNLEIGPVARTAMAERNDVKVSYEFFPPKNASMETALWDSIRKLESHSPEFVSVTYGAGGSTRERTHRTVIRMVNETSLIPAAHLTCVGSDISEIDGIAREYWEKGVRHIVALRGDPLEGIGEKYEPHKSGYAYGSDLVRGLKKVADFEVSVSTYPELHPESGTWEAELDNLKRKVDEGATRAITQFFFEAETFLRFQDKVQSAGIDIPIVAGLMLQPTFKSLKRMSSMCGIKVPDWYSALFDGLECDSETRNLLTSSLALELTASLFDNGLRDFHLYTLNRSELAMSVSRLLGLKPAKGVQRE